MEKDLFKKTAQCRRLEQEIKKLQDLNTENANNTNNTSSQFSLPSEFKEKWNEMVTELIMDAFPDFLDKYYLLVPLIHELFITVRALLQRKQDACIAGVASLLNLKYDDPKRQAALEDVIYKKLKPVFQEHNKSIFTFDDISTLIEQEYKPKAVEIVEAHNEGEFIDDLEENLSSSEFETFFKVVIDLNLHMVLNDPPITLDLVTRDQRAQLTDLLTRFDFFMFFK